MSASGTRIEDGTDSRVEELRPGAGRIRVRMLTGSQRPRTSCMDGVLDLKIFLHEVRSREKSVSSIAMRVLVGANVSSRASGRLSVMLRYADIVELTMRSDDIAGGQGDGQKLLEGHE